MKLTKHVSEKPVTHQSPLMVHAKIKAHQKKKHQQKLKSPSTQLSLLSF
jgi:hypothetical protein